MALCQDRGTVRLKGAVPAPPQETLARMVITMRRLSACLVLLLLVAALPGALLPTQAAARTAPLAGRYARVADAAALRLRSAPSYTATVTMLMPLGAVVHVLSGPYHTDWYRISYRRVTGYAHRSYLVETGLAGSALARSASYRKAQVVVVSLARQQLEAYQEGHLVLITAITTGQHDLSTPAGAYRVLAKYSPFQMISPWPPDSPYWYAPSWVSYAIQFTGAGHFLHDAPWRPYFGYGTDSRHVDPDGVWRAGSHGCINMPLWSAQLLYAWIKIGTVIQIVNQ